MAAEAEEASVAAEAGAEASADFAGTEALLHEGSAPAGAEAPPAQGLQTVFQTLE